jgi:hypothetical protein
VYFVAFGPFLASVGVPSYATGLILVMLTLAVILGFGLYLDRSRFWEAQATIGTARNPYLIDVLYNKELVRAKWVHLPMQRAVLYLLKTMAEAPPTQLVVDLQEGIRRNEEAVRNKKWEIGSDERVY